MRLSNVGPKSRGNDGGIGARRFTRSISPELYWPTRRKREPRAPKKAGGGGNHSYGKWDSYETLPRSIRFRDRGSQDYGKPYVITLKKNGPLARPQKNVARGWGPRRIVRQRKQRWMGTSPPCMKTTCTNGEKKKGREPGLSDAAMLALRPSIWLERSENSRREPPSPITDVGRLEEEKDPGVRRRELFTSSVSIQHFVATLTFGFRWSGRKKSRRLGPP